MLNSILIQILSVWFSFVQNKTKETTDKIINELKKQPGIKESNNPSSPAGGQGADYLGAFSVTIQGIEPHIKRFEKRNNQEKKVSPIKKK